MVHTGRLGPRLLGQHQLHPEVRQRGVAAVAGPVGAGRRMPMRAVAAAVAAGVASRSPGHDRRSARRGVGGLEARCATLSTG